MCACIIIPTILLIAFILYCVIKGVFDKNECQEWPTIKPQTNDDQIKELHRRIVSLENPFKYEVGQKVDASHYEYRQYGSTTTIIKGGFITEKNRTFSYCSNPNNYNVFCPKTKKTYYNVGESSITLKK